MSYSSIRYLRLLTIFLLSLNSAIIMADNATIDSLSVQQASTLFSEKNAIIVDVRENNEWQEQHVPNAIHIPLGELSSRLTELDAYKNSAIIAQCRSGKRSLQAAETLKSAGFTKVYNLEGGLNAWQKAGLPIQ